MAKVVYWSQTGNTQTMAEAVAKGITAAGGSVECIAVSDITPQDLAGEAVFALGCPAMGAEVLEESEMEPFVEELEKSVSGKKILRLRYGLEDGNVHTLEETGQILGVTRERIRQLESRALEKLRKSAGPRA